MNGIYYCTYLNQNRCWSKVLFNRVVSYFGCMKTFQWNILYSSSGHTSAINMEAICSSKKIKRILRVGAVCSAETLAHSQERLLEECNS